MTNQEPIDLNFVTDDVQGGTWLQWAANVTNITDLVDQAIVAASGPPRKCIRRLVIAGHGAENTNGFTVFDANTSGVETIDGGNSREPVNPRVEEQLRRLRPYFCTEAIIEFRVCRFGTAESGERAMQLIADITGVPVTAPVDEISSLAAIGGLATSWRMVYPAGWGKANETSFWRGDPEGRPPAVTPAPAPAAAQPPSDIAPITERTVTGQFVPLRGVNPPTLTPPSTLPSTLPAGPRSGIGGRIAAGVAAGALLVAVLVGLGLSRGGGEPAAVGTPTSNAASTAASSQPAAPQAAAPSVEVRVSPIEAVFTQSDFTTNYSVLVTVEPPGAASGLNLAWSGADCGTWGTDGPDGRAFRWTHPHPPCDATTDHSTRTITLLASWRDRQLRCTYQGAASGVGQPCVDLGTGAVTTPVGGGR